MLSGNRLWITIAVVVVAIVLIWWVGFSERDAPTPEPPAAAPPATTQQ